jgi:hypothetical protein
VLRGQKVKQWGVTVLHGLAEDEIYRVFDMLNGRGKLNMNPIDLFRFARMYGDPMRTDIWAVVVGKYGFHIPDTTTDPVGPNSVIALKALEDVHKNYGQYGGIDRTFAIISAVFTVEDTDHHLQVGAGGYAMLKGLGQFLHSSPLSTLAVIQRVRSAKVTAADVTAEARRRAANAGTSGTNSIARHVCEAMKDIMTSNTWRKTFKA